MQATLMTRQPAPALARAGVRVRRCVRANAFGNALGGSLASAASGVQPQGVGPYSAGDYRNGMDIDSDNYDRPYTGGSGWAADVAMRRQTNDPFNLRASVNDSTSLMRRAQALWGPMPAQADSYLDNSATNAQRLAQQMQQAGYDGELVPMGGASVRVSPGTGVRPAMVNGVSVNQRADAAFQAAGDLLGIGDMYRDYKLLGGLMNEAMQNATLDKLKGALQNKLGMARMLPTPELLGATTGIYADGSIRYNNADLIDRYGDALRKVEMRNQGIIELDTRSMLITSIGNQRMGPAQWVEENTNRYQRAFAAGVEEGQQRFESGRLRYPKDMPQQLQVGLFADAFSRDAIVRYNERIGVPEGPGQLLVMNRWAYDPGGSGLTVRPDMLMDLGPNRSGLIQRLVVDGKSSTTEAMSSGGQFGRTSNWLGGASITAATPQGLVPWTPRIRGR